MLGTLLLASAVLGGDLPFPVGEELVYSVSWNGIRVATAIASTSMEIMDGREVLVLRQHTETYAVFKVWPVDDNHETLVDPKTFLPIQYTKNIKEGGYRCHEITTFDFKEKVARYEHQTNGSQKEYPIEADTRDILSFLYFMRSSPLEPNQVLKRQVMADEKLYDLIVTTEEEEEVRLPDYKRKIPSLRMVPEAMFDGLFVRKGKATLWVSRDSRRLLTFAKVHVPLGSVRIKLQKVNGPGDDFWIKEKKDDDD
ncbi:DUF3108 domain-containing protein [Tichowtungia aerotolerans]|uniref:DUF3108 domain-containing protein n=1 Tax=Tichowtungia aerotolerans TaxID=2697043 RepID=A0A6P1M614_9BACT|nr:DUF3108 domain-containing protein [Tichowtungia aerotolerans]QHI70249.1 DUF3108 domain-containing protein [Tichowtungia aerotolerans]